MYVVPVYVQSMMIPSNSSVTFLPKMALWRSERPIGAPPHQILPKLACDTVPMFVWLNTDRSGPWKMECHRVEVYGRRNVIE